MIDPKRYAGEILRQTRESYGLKQTEFAKKLGVSVPYLSQMERNKRPLSGKAAKALVEEFGLALENSHLVEADRIRKDLSEALSDPVFGADPIHASELSLAATNAPDFARAFLRIHQAFRQSQEQLASLDGSMTLNAGSIQASPWEEVRDFFHYCDNYVDELDKAAELFAQECGLLTIPPIEALSRFLFDNHKVALRLRNTQVVRHFAPSSRTLTLSRNLEPSTQIFQTLHQIALLTFRELIEKQIELGSFQSHEARDIARTGLANYFAGAALMPYKVFSTKARELRHDLEQLAQHFGASVEQVAHRLSTLQRPDERGIPFFFVRVDQAGTITKRHSATRLQFARFGGACPLWNVHRAFETPGQFIRQLAVTPDGSRYFCLARDISKSGGSFRAPIRRYAIGLGCEVAHANDLVYADGLDLTDFENFEPIGVSCRICERTDCHQRSVPPLERRLDIDENSRGILPYRLPQR